MILKNEFISQRFYKENKSHSSVSGSGRRIIATHSLPFYGLSGVKKQIAWIQTVGLKKNTLVYFPSGKLSNDTSEPYQDTVNMPPGPRAGAGFAAVLLELKQKEVCTVHLSQPRPRCPLTCEILSASASFRVNFSG